MKTRSLIPSLALAVLLAAGTSNAAQRTWIGSNSTDLRDAANWVGGVAPIANTDSALFEAAGTAGANIVNPVAGNNQQYAGNFATGEGALQFNNSGTSYTFSGSSIRLGNGGLWNASSGTTQTFNNDFSLNTTNSFSFNATSATTVVNGNIDLNQGVGTRTVSVNFLNSTNGRLIFNGNFTNSNGTPGTGSLTVTGTANTNATGTVILAGSNSMLNGTVTIGSTSGTAVGLTLNSVGAIRNAASVATSNANTVGKLRYNAGSALTFDTAAPSLVMGGVANSPTLDISLDSADQQFSSAALNQKGIVSLSTTSGSNQKVTITGATTFGATNGNQSVVLNPIGNAALSLGAVSPVSLTTVVSVSSLIMGGNSLQNEITGAISNTTNNTVSLVKVGASTWALRGSNSFSGSTANTTVAGGKLSLDYSTNNNSKLADTGSLLLQGGTLELSGGNHTEVVGSTIMTNGGSQITRPSGTATISLGAITQTSGALNLGADNIATTTTTNTNSRLGGLSRITVGGTTFAKNDGSNNIVGMVDGDYTPLAPTSGSNAVVYSLSGSLNYTGASTTIGSLRIRTTADGQSLTINGTNAPAIGNSTTGAGAGAILFTGANDYSILNNSTGNALRASTAALLVHQWGSGNLTIGGTGNSGVVLSSQIDKFGSGRLIIAGNNSNTSTTATTIGGGILQVSSNFGLGNQTTGGAISLQGGTFVGDTTGGSFALNNSGVNHRNVTVGLTGGGIDVIGGNTLTVSGVISSTTTGTTGTYSAPLTLGSGTTSGTIVLTGTNTYTGGTILRGGTVEIQNAAALGTYALGTAGQANNYVQFTGGTLRYGTGVTTDLAQRIRYSTSAANINTNGQNITFANEVDYTNTGGLAKLGAGILTLSGSNTYSGATAVTTGTLIVSGTIGASSAVTVASGAQIGGDGIVNGNLTLSTGARFVFDLNDTPLTVGGTFALDSSFGVNSLVQADGTAVDWSSVAFGTYTLISTSFVFNDTNIQNFGLANIATGLGGGREAYFANGSLDLVVVPEPSTWALLAAAGTVLMITRRRRQS